MDIVIEIVSDGEEPVLILIEEPRPIELTIQSELILKTVNNGSSQGYEHTQAVGSMQWVIVHSFGFRPSVSVTDMSGEEMFGDVRHVSVNEVHIFHNSVQTGKAYLI